jgi:very-short-patch-repair endonuclease
MRIPMKNDFPRIYISPEIRRKMIEIAREFRKTPTESEKKLDGIKFRWQQPIGYFVVDFYKSVYRLVVEVDGPVHESQKEARNARQEILEELGLSVLRIKSEVIETNLPAALGFIRQTIRSQVNRKEIPSPSMGEGKGGG